MDALEGKKLYEEKRPIYKRLTAKIHSMLEELLKVEGVTVTVVESRTKKVAGFEEKINRPGKNYINPLEEITDLSGIRIVLYSLDDVEKVSDLVSREFIVDQERSVNKLNLLDADRFGYLSQHYIVKIGEPRSNLFEWKDLRDLWAEIQVRTVLQHAWAAIQHSLDYKSEYDIPMQLRRRLFRLSALFELADEELNHITDEAQGLFEQYKEQIESDQPSIELNLDSLKAYLEASEVVQEWADFIESFGVTVTSIGWISRDVEMDRRANIATVNEIDKLLKQSRAWGREYLREFLINTFGDPIPSNHGSMDRNGIVPIFLIGNFLEIFTDEILDKEFGWGLPERASIPAKKYNPKYVDAG